MSNEKNDIPNTSSSTNILSLDQMGNDFTCFLIRLL